MRYQFANVRTADFQRVAEEVYGSSLEWFFQQWIFRTGIPKLEYGWSKSQRSSSWELRIAIRQTQPEPPFILPMDIQVYSASKKEVFSRTIQSRDSTFVFLLSEEPTSVFLDEDEWILKESLNLTDIAERSKLGLSFRLEQNYPNPFNPTTTIRYELPASAFTTLQIFDVLGREVQTLVRARQEAGRYTINFDARHLPSGIYFYRLQSGKFSETKKMTLLK
jgi:aminopeptidase N